MKTIALLSVLPVLIGCGLFETLQEASPEQRWAASATLYVSTLDALTALRKAGKIDDDTKATIEGWRAKAKAALDGMEKSFGDPSLFKQAWSAFSAAIDVMIQEQAGAQ